MNSFRTMTVTRQCVRVKRPSKYGRRVVVKLTTEQLDALLDYVWKHDTNISAFMRESAEKAMEEGQ